MQQQNTIQNMALLQQQQQQQNAMLMAGNMQNPGMNMVNFSLPNVIPGVGTANFQNFNNNGNNPMMARDNNSMPPPNAAMTNLATNTPRRNPSGNDESSPLSPNSFHW